MYLRTCEVSPLPFALLTSALRAELNPKPRAIRIKKA